jgi:hypothetical protein
VQRGRWGVRISRNMVVEGASHQFELRQQPESAFFPLQVNMALAQGRQTSRGLGSIPWQFFFTIVAFIIQYSFENRISVIGEL